MLANDGAIVYSVDVTGMVIYSKGSVAGTIRVEDTSVSQEEALASASIVVSGVPSKAFSLPASGIRSDAICVNFSQFSNFGEGVEEKVAKYVPVIGKVTISMLERNLLRLHQNFHAAPLQRPPANFGNLTWTGRTARAERWSRDASGTELFDAANSSSQPQWVVIATAAIAGAAMALIGASVMARSS